MTVVPPLSARPLDALYVAFFIVHIPVSLLVDFQGLYPPSSTPGWMKDIVHWYLTTYRDPILAGGMGLLNNKPLDVVWLKCFHYIEGLFQFPIFFIGIWVLFSGRHKWYPLLIAYGASTATTLIPCVAYLVAYPTASKEVVSGFETMTTTQKWQVIGMMLPWIIIPPVMSIDLLLRVARVLGAADNMSAAKKSQ